MVNDGSGVKRTTSGRNLGLLSMVYAVCLLLASWGAAQCESHIDTIHIATPAWEDQTNPDGTGLFFDIVRRVYEPVGIRMTFDIVPWKRAEIWVESGRVDARLAVIRTRPDQLMPTYPLYVDYTVAIFKEGREWQGLASLDGKRCVWPRGYRLDRIAPLDALSLKWVEVDAPKQAWMMLREDRVDFYLDARIDVERYIWKHKPDIGPIRIETLYGKNAYIHFADTDKSRELIAIYDARILALFRSGELEKLFEKWGVAYTPEPCQAGTPAQTP